MATPALPGMVIYRLGIKSLGIKSLGIKSHWLRERLPSESGVHFEANQMVGSADRGSGLLPEMRDDACSFVGEFDLFYLCDLQ